MVVILQELDLVLLAVLLLPGVELLVCCAGVRVYCFLDRGAGFDHVVEKAFPRDFSSACNQIS